MCTGILDNVSDKILSSERWAALDAPTWVPLIANLPHSVM